MKEQQRIAYAYLLLTFFLWGSLYVVSKFVLGKLPTFAVAFGRYFIGYLALTVIVSQKPKETIARKDYGYIFIIGFLGYSISVGMQLMGTKLAGPSLASLLNSTNPITISIMAALILKERLTWPKIAGLVLSLWGVYLIIGNAAGVNIAGVILSFGSVILWSFMSVITRKVTRSYNPVTITRAAMGITVVSNLLICILELCVTSQPVEMDLMVFLGLCYIGIFCTALTLVLWNKSLSMLDASVCSAFYPVQTLTSSTLGILFLHETAGWPFFAGSALIIVGVLVSLLVKGKNC